MRDIMFEIPTREEIAKVIINEEAISSKKPELVMAEGEKRTPIKVSRKSRSKKGIESA
jgi:ATP-dependent Clp protease ATP-binding subunit ClpX